ncbi:hypothetical protein BJX76DRAFT_258763 [Aspergillus varians]
MLRTTLQSRLSRRHPVFADAMDHDGRAGESPLQEPVVGDPSTLSPLQKQLLYKQWIGSGRPHHIVCSECREPNNLVLCESCCRSYHASCLSPSDFPTPSVQFHCPACSSGQWDCSSSTVRPSTSPEVSRSGTPAIHPTMDILSPREPMANPIPSARTSPQTMQAPSPATDHTVLPTNTFDPSILSRAREFLVTDGGFPKGQEFSVNFLLKLGAMMTDLDLHRGRAEELVLENEHLRQDNANIRAYLDSNLATGKPVARPGGDSSAITIPSPDTAGKSWDRIVMDLI